MLDPQLMGGHTANESAEREKGEKKGTCVWGPVHSV